MGTPEGPQVEQSPPSGPRLRGPSGCLEWAVVVLGVVFAVLLVVFVIALVAR